MRFKSRMAYEHVQLLHNLIVPISRLTGGGGGIGSDGKSIGSGTTLYLDPDVLRISARGGAGSRVDSGGTSQLGSAGGGGADHGTEGIACFAELISTNGIFLDHKIESIADNVIVFDIDLVQLKTALQSTLQSLGGSGGGDSARSVPLHNSSEDVRGKKRSPRGSSSSHFQPYSSFLVVMKLAKRGGLPCLCLDSSCADGSLDVHHAVPVRILRAQEWQNHLPPLVNTPDVQLEFQLDRPLRPVVERLKCISPVIYLDGSMTGELVLRIDSENVAIRTFYDKLIPRFDDADDGDNGNNTNKNNHNPQPRNDPSRKCTLKMDSKKLSASLQWQSSMLRGSVSSYIMCMIENEMMVVHVVLNPEDVGFFTYYIPVHYMSPDMMEFG